MKWKLITWLIVGILIISIIGVYLFSGGTMKQTLINLNPFKLNSVMAQGNIPNQTQTSSSGLKIKTDSTTWKKTKHDGIQLQYFNTTITTLSNTKSKICLYPKTSLAVNSPIIQNSKAYLFKNNVQTGLIQPSDMEVEKQGSNVKKMCLDVDGSLVDKIRFGNASIVYEYQNDSKIIYSIFNFTTNFTLTKYNGESYVIAPQDIWVKTQEECKRLKNASGLCFGAIDNSLNETELHRYKYLVESTDNIKIENQSVYNSQAMSKNRTRKEVYNFKDICKQSFSNCSFNLVNNKTVEVYFTSNKYIDPTVSITYPDINYIGYLTFSCTGTENGYYFDSFYTGDCPVAGYVYSFVEFNITNYSTEHSGDTVLSVKLNIDVSTTTPDPRTIYFYNSSLQPSQTDWFTYFDTQLSNAVATNYLYNSSDLSTGSYSIDLGSQGVTEFTNQLSSGWFVVDIMATDSGVTDFNINTVSLDVEYESANCWIFVNNRYEIPPSCKLTISPTGVYS